MKRVMIGLAIVLLSSLACQHPSLNQAAAQQVSQAAVTTLPLSAPLGR
ncbi:MAG: hypothetical protein HYR94_13135 [Chloroflexi bacterium]|nr:hypothetical protein [Chloroflexota bacterium]